MYLCGINKIIKVQNVNKIKGIGGVSAKFVKMFADIIECNINRIKLLKIFHKTILRKTEKS